jgi:N-acetylglucosaminyl-diphospho-decaprenol L-rhamnosyltransferase
MTGVDPRVSIVVITRDRVRDLLNALTHLSALVEQPRILVVDNGSSDETVAEVRLRFPAVELIPLHENQGAAARNVAVARITTPYVAFADDDSWWAPGALTQAADLLDCHPRLALVNAHILVGPDERDDPICLEMAESPLPNQPGQPGHPLLSFIACAAMVRREPFEVAGGFHPRLSVGGEEEILGHDLVGAGWQLSYVPEIVVHHHASVNRDAHERRATGIRNTLWTTWLRRPVGPAFVRTVRLLRRLPRDRVTVRGLRQGLAGAPWVLRERKVSPHHVEVGRQLLEDQQLNSRARRYVS